MGGIKTSVDLYQAMDKFLGNREMYQGDPGCRSMYRFKRGDLGVMFPSVKAIEFTDLENLQSLYVADYGGQLQIIDKDSGKILAFDMDGNLRMDVPLDGGNFNLFKPFMELVERFLASPDQYQQCNPQGTPTKPESKLTS